MRAYKDVFGLRAQPALVHSVNRPVVNQLIGAHINPSVADMLPSLKINRVHHPILISSRVDAWRAGAQPEIAGILRDKLRVGIRVRRHRRRWSSCPQSGSS